MVARSRLAKTARFVNRRRVRQAPGVSASKPSSHGHTRRVKIGAFPKDHHARRQAAELLVEAFPHDNGWPTLELALEEVDEALAPERRCLAALDGDQLLGWIAAVPDYRDRVWELHPLVVRADARKRGVGLTIEGRTVDCYIRMRLSQAAHALWRGNKAEKSYAGGTRSLERRNSRCCAPACCKHGVE